MLDKTDVVVRAVQVLSWLSTEMARLMTLVIVNGLS